MLRRSARLAEKRKGTTEDEKKQEKKKGIKKNPASGLTLQRTVRDASPTTLPIPPPPKPIVAIAIRATGATGVAPRAAISAPPTLPALPPTVNPSGCARAEPRTSTSVLPTPPAPISLRVEGRDQKPPSIRNAFTAFQRMKVEWRLNVFHGRSAIQGNGLLAKRNIPEGTFIIEYVGEVIRSEVCEVREGRYRSQGRPDYFFKVDEDTVIDATMKGGPARYINHSCSPNAFTRVLKFGEHKKVVVIANQLINAGYEITYDYLFPYADDAAERVPCLCGAAACRGYIN